MGFQLLQFPPTYYNIFDFDDIIEVDNVQFNWAGSSACTESLLDLSQSANFNYLDVGWVDITVSGIQDTNNFEQVDFDETKQSQLPFVEFLVNMGYRYIPASEVLAERGGDTRKFILRDTAIRKLAEINKYEHDGEVYKFSDAAKQLQKKSWKSTQLL